MEIQKIQFIKFSIFKFQQNFLQNIGLKKFTENLLNIKADFTLNTVLQNKLNIYS